MSFPATERVDVLFAEVAAQTPDRVAITDRDGDLTYGTLLGQVRLVSLGLCQRGIRRGDTVLVTGRPDRNTVIAELAILSVGAAYVPVDPAYPAERVELMAQSAGAVLALGAGAADDTIGIPVTDLDSLAAIGAQSGSEPPSEASGRAGPDDLAYVMFTSGTTGRPKAVGVTHRGIIGLTRGAEPLRLRPVDGVLAHSTIAFDAATFEFWCPLLSGARIVAAPPQPLALHELAALLARPDVSVAWLTASVFQLLATSHPAELGTLRTLITGGDAVSAVTASAFATGQPGTLLVNGYGPTENVTFSTLGPATSWNQQPGSSFPIGVPLAGTSCYLLDAQLRPVRAGDIGDLYLGGERLARGYLGQPAATAEKFLPDPFADRPGARMYATGDRARLVNDTALEFCGRTDDEIKIRGFRVNLAEPTAALVADEAVDDAAVLAQAGPDGLRLVGFVTPVQDVDGLRDRLSFRVPQHLIPERIVALESMPLSTNGKVDRGALMRAAPAAVVDDHPVPAADCPSPKPDSALSGYWERHTGVRPEPESDFFFDGGSSLALMRLVEDVRSGLGITLDFADVYADPTYEELNQMIRAQSSATDTGAGTTVPNSSQRAGEMTGIPELPAGVWIRALPPQSDEVVAADYAVVDRWLREYVSKPEPELGRAGPVCPFVPPAINDEAVQFSFRYDADGHSERRLREVIDQELAEFDAQAKPLPRSGALLDCRLVVLPATGPDGWRRLDEVYGSLKDAAVQAGLMIGQFHPVCDEPAVRNPGFRVSVAPVGMFAIRRMAPHDVLFLHETARWFASYDRRFRAYYERGRVRDPLLLRLHRTALTRHGLPPLTSAEH